MYEQDVLKHGMIYDFNRYQANEQVTQFEAREAGEERTTLKKCSCCDNVIKLEKKIEEMQGNQKVVHVGELPGLEGQLILLRK